MLWERCPARPVPLLQAARAMQRLPSCFSLGVVVAEFCCSPALHLLALITIVYEYCIFLLA